ncbi:MAG: FAD-dependent oxidoreductase [Myxococcota bacterium]
MARTAGFDRLLRAARTAAFCDHAGLPTDEGVEIAAAQAARQQASRREFLAGAGATAALVAGGGALLNRPAWAAKPSSASADIAIIGGGLAGLACAYELRRKGVGSTVYEADTRVGGRCYSLAGAFPGQVVELGGELIDTPHKTMLGYAKEFKLTVEDVTRGPGEQFWVLGGERVDDAEIVEEFRAFVPAIRADLQGITKGLDASAAANPVDVALDHTSLREYLQIRGAGPTLSAALDAAYGPEFGREIDEQTCLNLLLFIHADRRSKFHEFGVFSDERYHVVGGNGQIPARMAQALGSQVALGHALEAITRKASGRYALTFATAGGVVSREADVVVLAIPFSTLRNVALDDASLGLPPWKRLAIDGLQYGTNAKMMVGMNRRTWRDHGGNGRANCLLPHAQNVWETNPSFAGPTAVLTDFAGGLRGASLNPNQVQAAAAAFLGDLDAHVFPGVWADATRAPGGAFRAVMQHWPSHPWALGSYTCNGLGYFTTIAGNEGKSVGNLYFVGEHTDSFYDWQGFMEGAAATGGAVAGELVQRLRAPAKKG